MQPLLSPKGRFVQDALAVRAHLDLADSSAVRYSIDQALLQLAQQYAMDQSPTASLNFYRLQGAQEFVKTWLTLGEIKQPVESRRTDELLDPDAPIKPKGKP